MKNYNLLNAILFVVAAFALVILIVCEFESTLTTVIQGLVMLLSLFVIKTCNYDFRQMYKDLTKDYE